MRTKTKVIYVIMFLIIIVVLVVGIQNAASSPTNPSPHTGSGTQAHSTAALNYKTPAKTSSL